MSEDREEAFRLALLELFEEYRVGLVETVAEVEKARQAEDWMTVRRLAHRIRGTAGTFGHASLGTLAGELEERLIAGGDAGALCSQFVEALEHFSRSNAPR